MALLSAMNKTSRARREILKIEKSRTGTTIDSIDVILVKITIYTECDCDTEEPICDFAFAVCSENVTGLYMLLSP